MPTTKKHTIFRLCADEVFKQSVLLSDEIQKSQNQNMKLAFNSNFLNQL